MTTAKPGLGARAFHALGVILGFRSVENPNTPITAAELANILSGPEAASGERVSAETALRVSAVKASVTCISESIAMLPLITYKRADPRGKERLRDDVRYEVLRTRPNPESSAFAATQALVANTLLWGNGLSEIVRNGRGVPVEIWPIESSRVAAERTREGELRYEVAPVVTAARPKGAILLKRDVLHVPALSFDGVWGRSIIGDARDTIGTVLAAVKFQGKFYKNAVKPSGVLEHPGKLSDESVLKRLRESWQKTYAGSENAGVTPILEEGMTFRPTTMPLEDAQFIESMKFNIEDIARLFRVPPHKIGSLERSTNNNIEQQSLDFLTDCLQPWVTRIEQEFNWKLFTAEERAAGMFCEHLLTAILRADMKTRAEFAAKLFSTGALTPDDIRDFENMNPLPEDRGTVAYIPANHIPAPTPEQADQLLAKAKVGSSPAEKPIG